MEKHEGSETALGIAILFIAITSIFSLQMRRRTIENYSSPKLPLSN